MAVSVTHATTASGTDAGTGEIHKAQWNAAHTLTGFGAGTSNPGSPSTGDLYFRTDLGLLIYYDGTRWLTVNQFREPMASEPVSLASHSVTGDTVGRLSPWHTTYDIWLEDFYSTTLVVTTNDGTKFWTVTLDKRDAANAATTIVSYNTSADTPSQWTTRKTAIGALLSPSTYKALNTVVTKTSTPGNIIAVTSLAYRLVIT